MPKKNVMLRVTALERKAARELNEGLKKDARKAAAKKPKPPKVDQKERAVDSLKKLSQIVERCLVALGEIKLPDQGEVPSKPEEHESVQAVKGQVPRV
jgi:hypothetical protein